MAHRVNIMLEDAVWRALQQVDKGERSRLVNNALTAWLKAHKRRAAAHQMDVLRASLPAVSAQEIAVWVREDRERQQ
ncbi:MAG: hypothetical protein ACYDB9_07770 [Gammaproteobacteria bacterium]